MLQDFFITKNFSIKFLLLLLIFLFSTTSLFPQSYDILKCDVKARIDSVWGAGYSAEEELHIFDSVWTLIDQKYACFQNLDIDWNAIKEKYRPEIAQGVSRGRFGAIINYLGLSLKEPHTFLYEEKVSNIPQPTLGMPLLFSRDNWRFGAGLSPLPDSSLLVYSAIENHPLGISAGDIVLGYDGIPWKKLYKKLLGMELPIYSGTSIGGNDFAYNFDWLQGAGGNWHLFDTIDIIKYSSKDTLHLSTSPLSTIKEQSKNFLDQLPVPGVPVPLHPGGPSTSVAWGIVEGTNIGYVYVWSWFADSSSIVFHNAIDSLTRIYNVTGLIFDFRTNNGGYVQNSDAGLRLLFDSNPPELFLAQRSNPFDHFAMRTYSGFSLLDDSSRSFNKPIAVLTGPHCISACDFICLRMKSLPQARFFGLSTTSGYASLQQVLLDSGVVARYAYLNGFEDENAPHYLTHEEFQVDEKVWHTPDDAAKGEDAVANAAIAWIKSTTEVAAENSNSTPKSFVLRQNYPNPFNPTTTISYSLPHNTHITLSVFDAMGRKIMVLTNEEKAAGNYSIKFDASNLSSGVYFYRLNAGSFVDTKKLVLIK